MPDGQQVAIVDEKMRASLLAAEDPIGKHIWHDPKDLSRSWASSAVVNNTASIPNAHGGIFSDARRPEMAVARSAGDADALATAMAREVHAADSEIPIYDVRTMQERLYDSLARQRFSMVMLRAFAVFAMLLAAIGIYGAMSYLVTQSTHDIGVRIALGASRGDILRMVIRRGMDLAIAGIALGLIGAVALTRVMATCCSA